MINGGTLYHPQVVRRIVSPDGKIIKTFAPSVIRHIPAKHGALAAVREGMAQVTEPWGTAYGIPIG